MAAIRVYHVEDYKIMRDGIKHMLSLEPEVEVVGQSKNSEEFLRALETTDFDVLILDLYLDAMEDLTTLNGFQICRLVHENYPNVKIVAHSAYDDADRISLMLKAGAVGFVSKKSGFAELIEAIKTVSKGSKYICPGIAGKLKNLNQYLGGLEITLRSKEELFSQREREVMQLLAQGESSKEIANRLFIAERTVESHRKNMIDKAKVKNTVELVAFASALGVIKK